MVSLRGRTSTICVLSGAGNSCLTSAKSRRTPQYARALTPVDSVSGAEHGVANRSHSGRPASLSLPTTHAAGNPYSGQERPASNPGQVRIRACCLGQKIDVVLFCDDVLRYQLANLVLRGTRQTRSRHLASLKLPFDFVTAAGLCVVSQKKTT